MHSRSWLRHSRLDAGDPLPDFADSHDPFLSLPFLRALESSRAVGAPTAWEPAHLLLSRGNSPAGLLPLYRKHDSRGEYIFDHSWANAYHRHGLEYYPKLVTAIPFTPVPGSRLLLTPGERAADWLPVVFEAVRQECLSQRATGWHGLFVDESWVAPAIQAGFAIREGCRFHWVNQGFREFSDFLDTLTSKKRKDIRRERRKLEEAGVVCRKVSGREADSGCWDFFYQCYERTYLEHGQRPYLGRDFFSQIAHSMAEQLSLVIAEGPTGPLASALFFQSPTTLYGRYWGALDTVDFLHFEVCYYQGIEMCIERGLTGFDPGTQGEHKLLRGFAPRLTHSLHWLAKPAFQAAIQRFVAEESREIRRYLEAAEAALPFRQRS